MSPNEPGGRVPPVAGGAGRAGVPGAVKVNPLGSAAPAAPTLETTTSAAPAVAPVGVEAKICVELITVTFVAGKPPMVTIAPARNP